MAGESAEPLQVLVIEDNPGDARLIKEMIAEEAAIPAKVVWSDRLENGIDFLARKAFDVLLLDLALPDSDGLETFSRIHEWASDIPIVVLSGNDDELLALRVVQEGAQDYLVKGQVDSHGLMRSLSYAIERKHLLTSEQSAHAEAERARREWTSIVAHDLRQRVTMITTYAQLLDQRCANDDSNSAAFAQGIVGNATRLDRMISDLLDTSGIDGGHLTLVRERIDLSALVTGVAGQFQATIPDHNVRVLVLGTIPAIEADPGRVEQVLSNLLSNAAKYGYADSEIQVDVRRRGQEVEVAVTNRGPGISAEDLPRLFSRFERLQPACKVRGPSLGLGLYITKGLIEGHGGRIWAESTPGETTTFHFTLPLTASR